ncbi:STAS domain-containing protein [Nocardioides caldifontis]|uniref:STAS domain-containing protein n=1 Tax=Nocardioides caldifontis TaxID=2588938 RepID=UPI00139678CC|nr:STAS domain-containing protein [Nocardioides caldifontis]
MSTGEDAVVDGSSMHVVEPSCASGGGHEVVLHLSHAGPGPARRPLATWFPPILDEGPTALVVDLSGLTRMSSSTVTTLLWLTQHCRARGMRMRLRGPSSHSRSTLRRAGLLGILPVERPDHGSSPARRVEVPGRHIR